MYKAHTRIQACHRHSSVAVVKTHTSGELLRSQVAGPEWLEVAVNALASRTARGVRVKETPWRRQVLTPGWIWLSLSWGHSVGEHNHSSSLPRSFVFVFVFDFNFLFLVLIVLYFWVQLYDAAVIVFCIYFLLEELPNPVDLSCRILPNVLQLNCNSSVKTRTIKWEVWLSGDSVNLQLKINCD